MLASIAMLIVGVASVVCLTLLLWLLNYAFDGIDLITWLEGGPWKLPVFGIGAVIVGVIVHALQSDSEWGELKRRCSNVPELLRQRSSYHVVPGFLEFREMLYLAWVMGTERGFLLKRPWRQAIFLPWKDIAEIRVDWTTHGGELAEIHLPNHDARSTVVSIPWNSNLEWWVPERVTVWNRGK